MTKAKKTDPPEVVQIRQWFHAVEAEQTMMFRERAFKTLFFAYPLLLIFVCFVILLQGFKIFGFQLDSASVRWLGGTVMAQLVAILLVVVRDLFRRLS